MKTLHPVDEETYERIGKAYLICSQYPDVFGDVTYEKFCSMFVDVIPDGEDERTARMRALAPAMYELLEGALDELCNYAPYSKTARGIRELRARVEEKEASDE